MLGAGMGRSDPGVTVSCRPTLAGFGLIAVGCLVTMYGFLAKRLEWPTYVPDQAVVMLGTLCIVFGLLRAKTKLYRLPVNNQAFNKQFRFQKIIGWALLLAFVLIPTCISLPKNSALIHMSAVQIAPWAAAYLGVFLYAGHAWSRQRESLLDQYAKLISGVPK